MAYAVGEEKKPAKLNLNRKLLYTSLIPRRRISLQEEMASKSALPAGEGQAVVIFAEDDGKLRLQREDFEKILLREDVRDNPIMILSIAGAMREGKSFILNFIIRYLQTAKDGNWLGEKSASLGGFSWRGGMKANTMGILMWSEPFHLDTPEGKVTVLLMDTQGLFDDRSTMDAVKTIFCMSFLLSSFQVYNVMKQIKDDMMQYFMTFVEYAQMVESGSDGQRFLLQRLMFLIRDWPSEATYTYGSKGGQMYIDKFLSSTNLESPTSALKNITEQVQCFLLPSPGRRVCETRRHEAPFVGALKDIDEKFVAILPDLMKALLCPENIVKKSLNGQVLTGKDLCVYARSLDEIFSGEELPTSEDILTSVKTAFYGALKEEFLQRFRKEINTVIESEELSEQDFKIAGKGICSGILTDYDARPKYESADESHKREEMLSALQRELEDSVKKHKNRRENLRKECCSLADQICNSHEIGLKEKFSTCCMPEVLREACADAAEIASISYPDLVCAARLEIYFQGHVIERMKRIEVRLKKNNDTMLENLKAKCKEKELQCKEFAGNRMNEELDKNVWCDSEIPRCKKEIKRVAMQHWDSLVGGLKGPSAIVQKRKILLMQEVEKILSCFDSKNQLNKERLHKQAYQTIRTLLNEYKECMATQIAQKPHETRDIEDFHGISCKEVKSSPALQDLNPYAKRVLLEQWERQVQTEFEKFLNKNAEYWERERRRCTVVKSNCIEHSKNRLVEICGRKFFDESQLNDCIGRIRESIMLEYHNECLTRLPSIYRKPKENLENYLKSEFVAYAIQRNERNKVFMRKEVDTVIDDMATACEEFFTNMLDGHEQDLSGAQMLRNAKIKLEEIVRSECTTAVAKDECFMKLEELLEDEHQKYMIQRENAEEQRKGAIKALKNRCIAAYTKEMYQLWQTIDVERCHQRALIEVRSILKKQDICLKNLDRSEVLQTIEKIKKEFLQKECQKMEEIENTKQRMIKRYRLMMENQLRGISCSETLLREYESVARADVNRLREKPEIDFGMTTVQLLKDEMENIRKTNRKENIIFEEQCKQCERREIKRYQELPSRVQDRLASDALALEEEIGRRLSSFSVGLKGNSETLEEYRSHLKDSLTKISSNRKTQLSTTTLATNFKVGSATGLRGSPTSRGLERVLGSSTDTEQNPVGIFVMKQSQVSGRGFRYQRTEAFVYRRVQTENDGDT